MKTLLESDLDIRKAHDIYNSFTRNKELRYAYEAREKWKKDYTSSMDAAHRKGIKEGKTGPAKKLLQKGFPIEDIVEITGLTEKEIRELLD